MTDLFSPSGIGDTLWILMRLERALKEDGRKLRIHTPPGNTAHHTRTSFLNLLPYVDSIAPDGINYPELKRLAQEFRYTKLEDKMLCEANTHLESGKRIEEYLPHIGPLTWSLDWQIGGEVRERARKFLPENKRNVIVYTSSAKNNDGPATGRWRAQLWMRIFDLLYKEPDIQVIWIGARYDADFLSAVHKPRISFVDERSDFILCLLQMADAMIGYQSGMTCITLAEQTPTLMLWFAKLEAMFNTLCHPSMLNNEQKYLAQKFDSLDIQRVGQWIKGIQKRK